MESEKMPELKGCPFCGGKAHHLHTKVRSSADPSILLDYDYCECKFCKASTRHFCDNKDAALASWDRRADLCATAGDAERVEALRVFNKIIQGADHDANGVNIGGEIQRCFLRHDHIQLIRRLLGGGK